MSDVVGRLAASNSELRVLLRQRSGKRQSLTKTLQTLGEGLPENLSGLTFYVDKLKQLKVDMIKLDDQVDAILAFCSEVENEEYLVLCAVNEAYIDNLNEMVIKLNTKNEDIGPQIVSGTVERGSQSFLPRLQLPKVELPRFDGRPEEFSRFIECFEAMLARFELSQFEKFSYLLQQVSGPARDIVNSVPQNDLSYNTAKQLLADAFSSETLQQFSIIEKLTNLKFKSETEYFHWISNSRVLVDQAKTLNIDSNIFMQYYLWTSLPDKFKTIYMNITNKSNPSLDEIIANAFIVHNRIKETSVHKNSGASGFMSGVREETITMATSVDSNKPFKKIKPCQLCNADGGSDEFEHKIQDCQKYGTPQSKLNKIQQLGGCSRCALLNHEVSSCRYKFFGKCSNCNAFHQYFLCVPKSSEKIKTKNYELNVKSNKNKNNFKTTSFKINSNANTEELEGNANAVSVSVMTSNVNNDIVVPTFTMHLPKNKGFVDARVMYDPASQVSFITENVAHQIKHKVIRNNVNVNITGFNSVKTIKTKIIELTVKLNNKSKTFEAIVVPTIKSKIESEQFRDIVGAFNDSGIPLADKNLTSNNGSIQVLLGVNYAHILPVQSCSFGSPEVRSLVYHTCSGIMICGSMRDLKQNLPHLNVVKDTFDKIIGAF